MALKRLRGWAAALVVVGAAGGLFWDKYFHSSINTSTEAEIRAAIPAGLLPRAPVDPATQGRYNSLVAVCKRLQFSTQTSSNFDQSFVPENDALAVSAMGLLHQGPIQEPSNQFEHLGDLRKLAKVLAFQALTEGKAGDSSGCERAIRNGFDLPAAMRSDKGEVIAYLVYVAIDAIATENAANCIRHGWLKPQQLRKLIGEVKEYGLADDDLAATYRQELQFQLFDKTNGLIATGKALQDGRPPPNSDGQTLVGNFDVLETAKEMARQFAEWISNTNRPWSSQDGSEEKRMTALIEALPKDPNEEEDDPTGAPLEEGERKPSWIERQRYKMAMNAIPNSAGINVLALSGVGGTATRSFSIHTSCIHSLLKALAAMWAYKEEHGGRYPGSLDELVTAGYLKQVPTDWFSQKPLLYNARTHVVYSVGMRMADEGGNITQDITNPYGNFGFAEKPRSSTVKGQAAFSTQRSGDEAR